MTKPKPYIVSIRPDFSDLPISEQFVLWAVRFWVKSNHQASALHLNLREGFRSVEMEEGYLMLDRIMTYLSTHASTEIILYYTCNKNISDHEHAILGVIAEFQTGDESNAQMVLSDWLPSSAVDDLGREFQEFAILLKANGLYIRERQWFPVGGEHPTTPNSPLPSVH